MTDFLLQDVKNYTGPKWALFITGGGMGLATIGKIPGSSKVIEGIVVPYSTEMMTALFGETTYPACSLERTREIYDQLDEDHGLPLVVNCALTTDRWRRGENHAYIQSPWCTLHIKFPKAPNEEEHNSYYYEKLADIRGAQDDLVSLAAAAVVFGNDKFFKIIQSEENKNAGLSIEFIQLNTERRAKLFSNLQQSDD